MAQLNNEAQEAHNKLNDLRGKLYLLYNEDAISDEDTDNVIKALNFLSAIIDKATQEEV